MILPPRVVVVLNQASTLNLCGEVCEVPAVTAGTVVEPGKVIAGSGSPVMAPATLRVAVATGVRLLSPR